MFNTYLYLDCNAQSNRRAREEGGGRREEGGRSAQVGVLVDLLLDAHQHGGVPLVEARYAVVRLHCLGERLHVLLLKVLDQFLQIIITTFTE